MSGEENDIKYSAKIVSIVSSRDNIKCLGELEAVSGELGKDECGKIWIKITDIKREKNIRVDMLVVESTGSNLKQVISNSQFRFGYVHIPEKA